ncbi:head maturation protease, ClpP-related [Achromobacter agilis]|uniref:ATP-dependent Clp protease proteolytic subunit n=1 Tax=Achromobacter agilis TaxID=1353888 RepID=A0A446CKV1_9BURK|nr:head maturation protease, ClpP-related [Achromobacter agilis]SSW68512.1 ATP-dependent Clp protease proteolytic subunit 1 [Achromobacter agilis]
MAKKAWYSITVNAQADRPVVEIRIYGEIGFWGTTAEAFVAELDAAAAGGADILVSLNSPGGDVFDAFAIYNALLRYASRVTTRVDGVAASAASLIAMAGKPTIMPENTQMMIHNAWIITGGTAEDLRTTAEMMDRIRDGVVAAYSRKSGLDSDRIIEMMDATTWMSALEAQALGFCDLIEEPVRLQMSDSAAAVLQKHKNLPDDVKAMLKSLEEDEPEPTPDPKPEPAPAPAPPADVPTASALAARVYAFCRQEGIADLAEGVLLSGALDSLELADQRVTQAKEIAGICLAAKLPEKAAGFVSAGLTVDQARARLFERVVADAGDPINNRPPTNSSAPKQSGPNPLAIYAKRKALSAT